MSSLKNGFYFTLYRKINTVDEIEDIQNCGTVTKHKWMGKTDYSSSKYEKKGTWNIKFQDDCTSVNNGAATLTTGFIGLALAAASLY